MATELDTPNNPWIRALDNNSTQDANLATDRPLDTTTEPASVDSGVADTGIAIVRATSNHILLRFFGKDTADDEIRFGIWGARKIIAKPTGSDNATQSWTYDYIAAYDGLLSTAVGISGAVVDETEFYVDTLTLTGTTASTTRVLEVFSPADNTPAFIIIDTQGLEFIRVDGDIDDSSGPPATEWNILYTSL